MKPILFNTEMVRAILDGRKTVTRRAVKPQPKLPYCHEIDGAWFWTSKDADDDMMDWWPSYENGLRSPYRPGDILYVRETWGDYSECPPRGAGYYLYRADYPDGAKTDTSWDGVVYDLPRWRPSIHMPKEAARLFLRVKVVRVERLQDITEEQAIQEGVYQLPDDGRLNSGCWTYKANPYENDPFGKVWSKDEGARNCFRWLWESTVKASDRDHYGWIANPWVWVIEVERIKKEEAEHG